ncbi:MAG: hypothetical protein ACR2OR_02625 [Hyphomicrobiales bacterium]
MQRIGIITGLVLEAEILSGEAKAWGAEAPRVYVSGPGLSGAAQNAEMLIHEGATALLSFGIAGGLSGDVAPGDMIVPERVSRPGKPVFECDANWRSSLLEKVQTHLIVHGGTLLSDQAAAATPERKRQLFEQTNALAIDMESAAIAEVAEEADVPFIAVRAIADSASEALPPLAATAINENGRLNAGAVAKSLLIHPTQITELPALARQTNLAKYSLRNLSRLAGPGFGLS